MENDSLSQNKEQELLSNIEGARNINGDLTITPFCEGQQDPAGANVGW